METVEKYKGFDSQQTKLTHPQTHAHLFTARRARLWLASERAHLTSRTEAFIHTYGDVQPQRGDDSGAFNILGSGKCVIAAQ